MKKFITIIVALISIMILGASLYAAGPKETLLREKTKNCLKAPSTFKQISFCEKRKVTLESEIEDRLNYFSPHIEFDKSQVEFYEGMHTKYGGYEKEFAEAKKTYDGEKRIVDYLTELKNTLSKEELSKVTFIEYALTYESANSFGVQLRNVCVGRFNNAGKLVSMRVTEDSRAQLFGDFFSIPKYYELLNY